ncbi:hypothetical protein AB833_27555 [Chromatiales bacterium (ex Bugula neritina AB1)]|nr:hypothetical protein AB833_27555 [Chromatiales bacterium (ex Bugula neritina AB1)]
MTIEFQPEKPAAGLRRSRESGLIPDAAEKGTLGQARSQIDPVVFCLTGKKLSFIATHSYAFKFDARLCDELVCTESVTPIA